MKDKHIRALEVVTKLAVGGLVLSGMALIVLLALTAPKLLIGVLNFAVPLGAIATALVSFVLIFVRRSGRVAMCFVFLASLLVVLFCLILPFLTHGIPIMA